jgi:signal transduction histidine kinase
MWLRGRLLLLLLVPMGLVLGGYGYVRLQREERALLAEEQQRMAVTAAALRVAVENALRDRQISDIKRLLDEVVRFQEEIDRVRVFDHRLQPLLVSNPLGLSEDVPATRLREVLEADKTVSFFRLRDGRRVLYTLVPLRDGGQAQGVMEIVRLAGHIDATVAAARADIVQRVGLLAVILGVLLWVGVRQSVLVPIQRLMAGVRALAAGHPEPIPVRGRDEFAGLARAFNDMAERLDAAHRRLVEETEARLELARQLQQAEQLVVAGRIASEVAHEIGTPLNVISGRAESLLRDLPADDPRAKPLRAILAQIDRIRGIMMSLLDVVRPRKPEVQSVGVAELLGNVAELLRPTARARGLTLTAELVRGARVMADPHQLQQVVINLLVNAIEATPAGGRITLEAAPVPGAAGEPGVELQVRDTGTGIVPEHLPRIFEPFFTTKPPGQGTGLGLAICHEIVREHGGVITVESRPGAGTAVRVWLPTGAASAAA